MNSNNIDIEKMRKAWIEMGESLGMRPCLDSDPQDLNNKQTTLDHLKARYRVFWTLSLIFLFSSFTFFSMGFGAESHMHIWLGAAYAVYFLTTFCMDFWLWRGVSTIDPLRMGIAEIWEKSAFYRKRHLQFMILLIPMAIALVGFTGYVFSSEEYFLTGMIVGVVCGLIIGTIQFRRFMAEYRKLRY